MQTALLVQGFPFQMKLRSIWAKQAEMYGRVSENNIIINNSHS